MTELYPSENEKNILANSTLIPNLIDDMDLSPYAVRLYIRLKRRVKQNKDGSTSGVATDSTKTLAKACKMSPAMVTRAKRELVNAGLIIVTKRKGTHGEWDKDVITILNIWQANKIYYSPDGLEVEYIHDGIRETLRGKKARDAVGNFPELKAQIPNYINNLGYTVSNRNGRDS